MITSALLFLRNEEFIMIIIKIIYICFFFAGVINWLGSHDKEGSIMGILEIIVGLLIRYTC